MKIGILTLPLHTNYGGILQAYALQTVLERMGHEVKVINRNTDYKLPLWKTPLVYSKRIIKNILGYKIPLFYEQKLIKEQPIIRQNTDRFIQRYIHTLNVDNYSDLKAEDFDAIVVGSDQVWRPKYFGKIEDAYLQFAKDWNIKRIAYAASFGTAEWEYTDRQTAICKDLIKKFDAVSVREDSGKELCKKYFGVDAEHLLDPTMLLEKEDYIRLFENSGTSQSPGTLMCYILDETPEKQSVINRIAREKDLIPFRVNSKVENYKAPLVERIQPPVEQWIRGFYDAEFVVTDSFHACVFAILFNKPFIAISNKGRGESRFQSLLKLFDLDNRIIELPPKTNKLTVDIDVFFGNINSLKRLYIKKSISFIGENLHND